MIFNDRLGDVAERFLRKGRKVYVEGALQTRKWTDQSGQEHYYHGSGDRPLQRRTDLLDSTGGEEGGAGEGGGYRERAPAQRATAGASPRGGGPSWEAPKGGDLDDEIPF